MFAAACITLAVTLLLGVRHEDTIRAWAMSPRTPRRVAYRITQATGAAGTAIATATAVAAGATVLLTVLLERLSVQA